MKEENFGLALLISKRAGLHGKALVSTSELAGITGFSQQSISRKLRALETEGMISRKASTSGVEVSLTQKGRKELEAFYLELGEVFSGPKKASLKGRLVDGLGEGAYYTTLPGYKGQFRLLLGSDIFPGTLNLEVNPDERALFTAKTPLIINGFKTKERTFGGIDCWQCSVNGKAGALAILPHRTNHPQNIIEIVADYSIRKKFGLKNGSSVELTRD